MSRVAGGLRCAIYTRKSSEEGLEQNFNSLHAQREACEAYVRSQVGEGWRALPTAYDDGGFSGGSMERPGLRQLLADIAAHRIDVVVVYKVDRLTRSLADFAKIVEIFDASGVSFVSVTQAFNTTTSMGRLTLNVLLSFAQFEREVTGERIRDKIAASKAKGLWMGGNLALGYDPDGRTLKINEAEAAVVRHAFARYLELESVDRLRAEMAAQGCRSKVTLCKNGRVRGGVAMNRGALFYMLANRLYVGEVPHKGAWHAGQHPPIVDVQTFETVQAKLAENAGPKRRTALGLEPLAPRAPLQGLVFDASSQRMTPISAKGRNGAVHRYYFASPALGGSGLRVPARQLEDLVRDHSSRIGAGDAWPEIRAHLEKVQVSADCVTAWFRRDFPLNEETSRSLSEAFSVDDERIVVRCPVSFRRGRAVILAGPEGRSATPDPRYDAPLLTALARAEAWKRELAEGRAIAINDIARREGLHLGYAQRLLRLAFLAPDLKRSVLDGRAPLGLSTKRLLTSVIPDLWQEQRRRFN